MKQLIILISIIAIIVSSVVTGFTLNQIQQQKAQLTSDLERRTSLLADSFKESIKPSYLINSTTTLQAILDKFAGRERLLGLAIYNNQGRIFASSTKLSSIDLTEFSKITEDAMDADSGMGNFFSIGDSNIFVFSTPIHDEENVIGSVVVLQRADYIKEAIRQTWNSNLIRLSIQVLLFSLSAILILRWIIYRPVAKMAEAIRRARSGNYNKENSGFDGQSFFKPVASEITKMSQSLIFARNAAISEARMRLEKLDSPWTAERLKEFFKAYFKNRQIIIISNREPYIHKKDKTKTKVVIPPSGMITALEPIMEACGGTWIACGSGDGDKLVVDKNDKIAVPPDDPKYILKRIWLSDDELKGFYTGFSNEALWPLCHMAHVRPTFRKSDWEQYQKVNGKFAQSLLSEIKNIPRPLILVQDYHFALLPEIIKKSRPDAEIGLFWHIPWPNAESFSICPWRREILGGILGADIIGFHTQQYCNNFFDTVSKEIESLADLEKFSITHKNHTSYIKPFPISVNLTHNNTFDSNPGKQMLKKMGIKTKYLGIGVDRMDYTKGILERFRGVEFFLKMYPKYKGQFTFLQIAPPSRESVNKYRQFGIEVTKEAERINQKYQTSGWRPIILVKEHHSHEEIYALYRVANVCMVTSLSDGMNLVSKEFVASRDDECGVLILSEFTGAARDLKGAIKINPYSAEETAEAIFKSINMPPINQRSAMKKMRESVKNYNIYRWGAEFLKAITNLS